MAIFRTLNSAFGRLALRMQGQDVERSNLVPHSRLGSDYAAMMRSRSNHGTSSMGMGR